MSSLPDFVTPAEYLELERRAERKSEYFQGKIFPMAGATTKHVYIALNTASELRQQLKRRPFGVGSADWRLRVSPTGLFTYPDVMVVHDPPRFADDQRDTVLNPVVIIEVLSDSSRGYDGGEKFRQYRTLDSLMEYLTIEQDAPFVEHHTRQPDNRWLLTEYSGLEPSIELPSIGCALAMAEVYDKVEFTGPSGS